MRLGPRNDVLDVRLALGVERIARVGAVDAATELVDDLVLDGLRVRVVVAVVRCAAVLGGDFKAAPQSRLVALTSNDRRAQGVDRECADRLPYCDPAP